MFDIEHAILFLFISIPFSVLVMYLILRCINATDNDRLKGGKQMSITVEVRKGNLEKAMRVLKKKVQKEGIVRDLKLKQYYEKPSEIKRRKKKEGIKNFKKKMKKLELQRGY